MTLHPRRWLVPLALAALCQAPLAGAVGAPSLLPPAPLDEASAAQRDWVPHAFALGVPALDFTTYIPADATVEISPLPKDRPLDAGNVAHLRIVAKVTPDPSDAPVTATITTFQVPTAPAAARICTWLLEEAGYRISAGTGSSDLTAAQRIGHQTDGQGQRQGSALSACYVRGDRVLTLAFQLDSRAAANEEQRRQWSDTAADFASGMLTNLRFADGRPTAHDDQQLRRIPAVIGEQNLGLVVPNAWDVRINDFQGSLPAELHLTRGDDSDTRGTVWLAAIPAPRSPTPQELTAMGKRLFPGYLMGQTPDLRAYAPAMHAVDPVLQQHGIPSQHFRFPVTNRDGERAGDMFGLLAWHDHTVYALSLWSRIGASTQRNEFFSRLPGLTAYDMLHGALTRHLAGG